MTTRRRTAGRDSIRIDTELTRMTADVAHRALGVLTTGGGKVRFVPLAEQTILNQHRDHAALGEVLGLGVVKRWRAAFPSTAVDDHYRLALFFGLTAFGFADVEMEFPATDFLVDDWLTV